MFDDVTSRPYPGLLRDLVDNALLRLAPGERLWKLYILRPVGGGDEQVEHRIYTKLQINGLIGLVSYTFRLPQSSQPARSDLAYAHDIPETTLNQLIWNVVRQSQIGPDELDVINLTEFATFEEQLTHLRGQRDAET